MLLAGPDSYWADFMSIPYNQQIYEKVEPREVHYCIIDAHEYYDFRAVKASFEDLKAQYYLNWTAVYFSKN